MARQIQKSEIENEHDDLTSRESKAPRPRRVDYRSSRDKLRITFVVRKGEKASSADEEMFAWSESRVTGISLNG